MKKIFCIIGFVFCLSLGGNIAAYANQTVLGIARDIEDAVVNTAISIDKTVLEDHTLDVEDLYLSNYKSVAGSPFERKRVDQDALDTVARQTGLPTGLIEAIVTGKTCGGTVCEPSDLVFLEQFCPGQGDLQQVYISCRAKIEAAFYQERELKAFSFRQHKYAVGAQAFVNGTLRDTNGKMFDIIIDLNIIDVILFGKNATIPQTASPFFPRDARVNSGESADAGGSNTENEEEESTDNENDAEDTDQQTDDDNTAGEDDSDQENEGDESSEGDIDQETDNTENNLETIAEFCVDPESMYFEDFESSGHQNQGNNTGSNGGDNGGNSGGTNSNTSPSNSTNGGDTLAVVSEEDIALGNFFSQHQADIGGEYPDIASFESGDEGCGPDEEAFLGGRICVPKFCNDIICIKITMTPGYSEVPLRSENCVECHIERGLEALSSMMATIGKTTPQTLSQEPFFLSAFANLFKNVTNGVTLHKKRLPFLVYDKNLSDQKKDEQNPEGQKTDSENKEDKKNKRRAATEEEMKEIMKRLDDKCSETGEVFSTARSTMASIQYCLKLNRQREYLQTKSAINMFLPSAGEVEQKNKEKSETYHNIVMPFFWQLSADMADVNAPLLEISSGEIEKNKLSCTVIAQ